MLIFSPSDSWGQKQQVEEIVEIIKNRTKHPHYALVCAHRGYWADYPENSTAAYDMAIDIGADMIEMDVRLTADDTMVVFHDACLDRVTTGCGMLREASWDYVRTLFLKTKEGEITSYKMLSLSDALDYLKDKAVIALDIKEGGRLFDVTMIRVLQMLKEKGMLWQSIVKGKKRLADLENKILSKAQVTLDDFMYTPITYATTPNISDYLAEFIATKKIPAIQLGYKQSKDPILPYVETVHNAGIWVGIYSFWPETDKGVVAEKNPLTDCDPVIRKYDFKDSDPNNPLDDGRGDWDWSFAHGADYVIADRSELLIEYLDKCGRREK